MDGSANGEMDTMCGKRGADGKRRGREMEGIWRL
jgi:hypothetical protein